MDTEMDTAQLVVDGHPIRELDESTWPDFVAMVTRHKSLFSGCWCVHFHCHPEPPELAELGNREFKHLLVSRDRAHAALVYEGDEAVAWAEYGPPDELQNIHHRKQWEAETTEVPDFRITCLQVDKRLRRQGLAAVAVRGALALIAERGGGLVEAYPHDLPPEKKMSSSFLYNATRTMYERLGFTYVRPKGAGNCVMTMRVAAAD